jgi:hypothetical protein
LAKSPDANENRDSGKPNPRTGLDFDLYAFSEVSGDIEVFAIVQVSLSLVAEDSALVLGLHKVEEFLVVGCVSKGLLFFCLFLGCGGFTLELGCMGAGNGLG